MYYAFVVMSIGGTIALRRRKVTSFPLWAIAANVAIATMLTFGDTRYRISFDVSLVLSGHCERRFVGSLKTMYFAGHRPPPKRLDVPQLTFGGGDEVATRKFAESRCDLGAGTTIIS